MNNENKTIMELLADIQREAAELEKLSKMSPMDFLEHLVKNGDGPTVQELTLSEMVGHPIKITN